MDTVASNAPRYTLTQLVRYMLRLGTLGFGGPVALVGYMQRDLVEERKWISPEDYKEGLAFYRDSGADSIGTSWHYRSAPSV